MILKMKVAGVLAVEEAEAEAVTIITPEEVVGAIETTTIRRSTDRERLNCANST